MTDQIVFLLQLVIAGVAVGAVYSLMALGFVLIYKASTVVNFGPGELVLFGAYVAWATILHMKLPLWFALPLTLVVAIVLGLVIERGILRPLIGEAVARVNQDLPESARVRAYDLFDKELDADDGELTRTNKVRRATILTKYGEMIEALYAGHPAGAGARSGG